MAGEAAQMESKARQELPEKRLEEMRGEDEEGQVQGEDGLQGVAGSAQISHAEGTVEPPAIDTSHTSTQGTFDGGPATDPGQVLDLFA